MTSQAVTHQDFSEFSLPEPIRQGIADASFQFCTPIQAEALPPALAGQDVAGQAQTGTGKTAAFLIATFNALLTHEPVAERKVTQPRALILAPTRELAIQIHKDACDLGRHCGLRFGLIYGGTGYDSQRQLLEEGLDVLIGTPGRIIDFFKQRLFDLKAIQVCVMDEADRMFDLGFIKDIRFLLRRMPPPAERLNMLFSATLSFRVMELAYEHMNSPQRVVIDADRVLVEEVKESVYFPANEEKVALLISLLRHMEATRALVFVNMKRTAERLTAWLSGNGFEAATLSGDVPQNKRERLLESFRNGSLPVLVATDVAARGLHIPDVSHVFNYDLPQDAEDYVHRIGRTARAGASGDAISFACEDYAFSLVEIQEYIGHEIPVEKFDEANLVELRRPAPIERHGRSEAGRRGRRPDSRGHGTRPPRRTRPRAEPVKAPRTSRPREAAPPVADVLPGPSGVPADPPLAASSPETAPPGADVSPGPTGDVPAVPPSAAPTPEAAPPGADVSPGPPGDVPADPPSAAPSPGDAAQSHVDSAAGASRGQPVAAPPVDDSVRSAERQRSRPRTTRSGRETPAIG